MFHVLLNENKQKKPKPTMSEYLEASKEASAQLQAKAAALAASGSTATAANPFAALLGTLATGAPTTSINHNIANSKPPAASLSFGLAPPSDDPNVIGGFDFNILDSEIAEMQEESKRLARDADRAKKMELRQRAAKARDDGETGNYLAPLPTGDAEAEQFAEMVLEMTQGDKVLQDGKKRKTHLKQKLSVAKGVATAERRSAHATGLTYKAQLQKSKQKMKKNLSW